MFSFISIKLLNFLFINIYSSDLALGKIYFHYFGIFCFTLSVGACFSKFWVFFSLAKIFWFISSSTYIICLLCCCYLSLFHSIVSFLLFASFHTSAGILETASLLSFQGLFSIFKLISEVWWCSCLFEIILNPPNMIGITVISCFIIFFCFQARSRCSSNVFAFL